MAGFINSIIQLFGVSALVAQLAVVVVALSLVISYFNPKGKTIFHKIIRLLSDNFVAIILLFTAAGTAGSLFLSEIAGYPPCNLCWYQRVFMYPQVVIAGIALLTNDTKIRKYILPLSIIGLLIALYHYVLQLYPEVIPCGDSAVSCSAKQLTMYGFITIPVMSAIAFTLIILVTLATYIGRKK